MTGSELPKILSFAETIEDLILPRLTDQFGEYFDRAKKGIFPSDVTEVDRLERRIGHGHQVIRFAQEADRRAVA